MNDFPETPDVEKKPSKIKEYLISGVALAVTIGLCCAVVIFWDYIQRAQQYGYVGLFIISIFAGGTVIIPVPGLLLVFTFGSILHPAIVGAASGLGEAIGSMTIYLTGYGGHGTIKARTPRIASKFGNWLNHRGGVSIFLMSAVVNPFFYPFTIIAGMLRFGFLRFFLLCWGGKTVKNCAVAYVGYFGLGSILRLVGIGV
jgi:membrane protein YqaA with SNARE-associated domain